MDAAALKVKLEGDTVVSAQLLELDKSDLLRKEACRKIERTKTEFELKQHLAMIKVLEDNERGDSQTVANLPDHDGYADMLLEQHRRLDEITKKVNQEEQAKVKVGTGAEQVSQAYRGAEGFQGSSGFTFETGEQHHLSEHTAVTYSAISPILSTSSSSKPAFITSSSSGDTSAAAGPMAFAMGSRFPTPSSVIHQRSEPSRHVYVDPCPLVEGSYAESQATPDSTFDLPTRLYADGVKRSTTTPLDHHQRQDDHDDRRLINRPTANESFAETLAEAMAINRLPIQEPEVFLGDALQYPTWKSSFEFLIERQRIASGQKILFLRNQRRRDSKPGATDSQSHVSPNASTGATTAVSHKAEQNSGSGLTAMVVPVYVSTVDNPDNEILTYALLDTMSNTSFVVQGLAEEIEASAIDTTLRLSTMTDDNVLVKGKRYDGLQVRSAFGSDVIHLSSVISRPHIHIDPCLIPTPDTVKLLGHLQRIATELMLLLNCPAGLLIGYDHAEALMPVEVIQGTPFAIRTVLGWSVIGRPADDATCDVMGSTYHTITPTDTGILVIHVYRCHVVEASCAELVNVLERDFAESDAQALSQEDRQFLDIIETNVIINKAGHYEMPLPFKENTPVIADNRGAAFKRTMGLKQQFDKRPDYLADYVKFMNVILQRGDAELVPENEIDISERWYIPHHGVYNPKKPGKIRVVFDCSAKHRGVCLNDLLLKGPDLISSLSGVLCRFRKGPIAFACDIEKTYHQFHVTEPHRDFLRFLWWENGDTTGILKDYRMKVHIFGAASSPGCANFGLKQVAKDNRDISPEASDFLQRDFYVDDGLYAEDSVKAAKEILTKARKICEWGNLRLHKLMSNSKELLSEFPDSEIVTKTTTSLTALSTVAVTERTLGLQWNTENDTLGFSYPANVSLETRRGVLSTIASVYDPLGFIAPFVLRGRLILQSLCRDGLDWDDEIPIALRNKWKDWIADLTSIDQIAIPRNVFSTGFRRERPIELHHFSDASTTGYGQCSYLRTIDEDNVVHSTLIVAKARVAPMKYVTVPRLELTAAVLAVKMAKFLQAELNLETIKHYFWTDSMIVLAYIKNVSKRFHVFVANRVQQILDFTKAEQWNHVVGEDNPADFASRGLSVSELIHSSWFSGPQFLQLAHTAQSDESFDVPEYDPEVKSCYATGVGETTKLPFEEICGRFSSKTKLIKVIAVFVRRCLAAKGITMDQLSLLRETERRLAACIQHEHFERPVHKLTVLVNE
ncbi:hypothetical protein ACOMHN_008278 [Nucella lapillus]